MKKVLALALAASLSIGLLAGCGGDTTPQSSGGDVQGSGSGAPTELTLWLPIYQFGDGISDEEFWNAKLDAFEAENTAPSTWRSSPGPTTPPSSTPACSPAPARVPDVVYVTETYDLINAGLLAPLDEYITDEDREKYVFPGSGRL